MSAPVSKPSLSAQEVIDHVTASLNELQVTHEVSEAGDNFNLNLQTSQMTEKRAIDKVIGLIGHLPTLTHLSLRDKIQSKGHSEDHRLLYWSPKACQLDDVHLEFLGKKTALTALTLSNCANLTPIGFELISKFSSLTHLGLLGSTLSPRLLSDETGKFDGTKVQKIGAQINACPKITSATIEILHPGGPSGEDGFYLTGYTDQRADVLLDLLKLKKGLRAVTLYHAASAMPKLPIAQMAPFLCTHPDLQELTVGNSHNKMFQKKFAPHELAVARAEVAHHQDAVKGIDGLIRLLRQQTVTSYPKEEAPKSVTLLQHQKMALYDKSASKAMESVKVTHMEASQKLLIDTVGGAYICLIFDQALRHARSTGYKPVSKGLKELAAKAKHEGSPFFFSSMAGVWGHAAKIDILTAVRGELEAMISLRQGVTVSQADPKEGKKDGKPEGKSDAPR